MDKDGLNWLRIGALSLTMATHVVAFLLVTVATAPPALVMPDAEQVVMQVTFVGRPTTRMAAPPPAPESRAAKPKPSPVKLARVAPKTPVQVVVDESDRPESVEVLQLPDVQLPQVDTQVRQSDAKLVTAELAESAEGNPDLPPTERLEYRASHPPVYPVEAVKNRQGGWVWLRVLVDEKGLPTQFLRDPRTTAADILVDSAIAAIRDWRFNPAIKSGVAVRAWIAIPIGFFVNGAVSAGDVTAKASSTQSHGG